MRIFTMPLRQQHPNICETVNINTFLLFDRKISPWATLGSPAEAWIADHGARQRN